MAGPPPYGAPFPAPQQPYGGYAAPVGPAPGILYAGFWRRTGGYLIDGCLLGIVFGIVAVVVVLNAFHGCWVQDEPGAPVRYVCSQSSLTTFGVVLLLVLGTVAFFYFGVLVANWGHTLGQAAVGVRVVCRENIGAHLPLGRAILRSVVFWGGYIFSIIPGVGALWGLFVLLAFLFVIWDREKQGLHDKLGNALVIRMAPYYSPYGFQGAPYGGGGPQWIPAPGMPMYPIPPAPPQPPPPPSPPPTFHLP